jgi:hypothetical protein
VAGKVLLLLGQSGEGRAKVVENGVGLKVEPRIMCVAGSLEPLQGVVLITQEGVFPL